MIWAGLDSNGTDHNRHSWIVPGGGSGLVLQSDGSLRTAALRGGRAIPGATNSYMRPYTRATFRPPYSVSGHIRVLDRLPEPIMTFGENQLVRWEYVINFSPAWVDEDNNVMTGASLTKGRWSATGQIDKRYGIPRDYLFVENFRFEFGRKYSWRVEVPKVGHHRLFIDDRLMYEVVEKDPPAKWWDRPIHVALRIDFHDVELWFDGEEGMDTPTFHSRGEWQDPRYPVFGPRDNPADNDTVVLHYTAADDLIDGDPGEHARDLPAYLRAIQRDYVLNRGYSIGYQFAVDWLGGVWQLRGWEYQSAANRGHNDHTYPILCLVDGADPVTDEAAASIRWLIGEAERRSGRKLKIVGHQDIGSTACPGVGIQAQIRAGVFSAAPVPPEPPVPQPPTEGTIDMEYIMKPVFAGATADTEWLAVFGSGQVRRAVNADVQFAQQKGLPIIGQDSSEQHAYLVAKFGV